MRILIADDEQIIREGLQHLNWLSIGLNVCGIAKNGKEALQLVEKEKPDIILTDIRMPIIDGIEMTEQILKKYPLCAVIFLSGYKDFDYAKRGLQLGAFDYLLKPTSPEEVFSCCERAKKLIEKQILLNKNYLEFKNKAIEAKIQQIPEVETKEKMDHISAKKVVNYIEEHYNEELTLTRLSQEFHFNAIYINRVLKKETNYTFLEILNNKRMQEAMELLKQSEVHFGEVANAVGISDQRYFSSIFKKYFGQSPRQYHNSWQRDKKYIRG
ncbi:response regulator transcription factor [Anaerocolumna sp. MB42-C2]|uniref:response regulator transcription factor n=1 Tax=Anaerocolumna sp. MB42-C2 TaxID=3070997 RepID=UPI0027E0C9EA|nr:response regulator [Anaerocolumna sp. MB42-C2]WMJ85512.1 response regulator [Anaerocolumna sp. MB42-C2]